MTLKRIAIIVGIIVVIAGGIWWQRKSAQARAAAAEPEMETAKVERKDLQVTVAASGVLEALTTVEVKSRSGGEIKRLFLRASAIPMEAMLEDEALTLARISATEDAREGIRAQLEKRKPVFAGK